MILITTPDVERRMSIERRIIRHLIREAKKDGWECVAVNNGGDEDEVCTTEAEVMDHAFATDEAQLYFRKPISGDGAKHWVFIVLGNDGYDVIADHSYVPAGRESHGWNELMTLMDEYCDKLAEEAV